MARRRSNTMGNNKIKEEDALQEKLHQSTNFPQPTLIKVHMRRPNKPARLVQIPSTLSVFKLAQTIDKQFHIGMTNQIVFLRGQRLPGIAVSHNRTLTLTPKDIIHIHNVQNITKEAMPISLEILNVDYVKLSEIKLTVSSKENIRAAFQNALMYELEDVDRCVYAQSGRLLDLAKTFEDEAVESDSIVLVARKKCGDNMVSKLELREVELIQYYKKLMKRPSLNLDQGLETPNFKKKQKYNVYKSMFVPESKEIIWQQDSNSSFSRRLLIKKLLKKRPKLQTVQIYKENVIESNQSNISSSQREAAFGLVKQDLQLKPELNECKRLILSQCLPSKNQYSEDPKINLIKPPPKISDDLFEQIEEMQFGDEDEEGQQDSGDGHGSNGLYLSAPLTGLRDNLKCSVGKMKGAFVPVISRNFDDDDDDD